MRIKKKKKVVHMIWFSYLLLFSPCFLETHGPEFHVHGGERPLVACVQLYLQSHVREKHRRFVSMCVFS